MTVEQKFFIFDNIGEPAALEQLAEECAELGKAALKLARIWRGENPTPVRPSEAIENLIEEMGDVQLCIDLLPYSVDLGQIDYKLDRWGQRIREEKDGKNNAAD